LAAAAVVAAGAEADAVPLMAELYGGGGFRDRADAAEVGGGGGAFLYPPEDALGGGGPRKEEEVVSELVVDDIVAERLRLPVPVPAFCCCARETWTRRETERILLMMLRASTLSWASVFLLRYSAAMS